MPPKEYDPVEVQHSLKHASLADMYDLLCCTIAEISVRVAGGPEPLVRLFSGNCIDPICALCEGEDPSFADKLDEFSGKRLKHNVEVHGDLVGEEEE